MKSFSDGSSKKGRPQEEICVIILLKKRGMPTKNEVSE